MITITTNENFTYITYNSELYNKSNIAQLFNMATIFFIFPYLISFNNDNNYLIYIYFWLIYCLFFFFLYKIQGKFSKTEFILYTDKIEIKKSKKKFFFLYKEIEKIEFQIKVLSKGGTFYY
ncbi:hypothetical protein, partial [Fusobacterium nucleatum]